jgi:hypothetical protein
MQWFDMDIIEVANDLPRLTQPEFSLDLEEKLARQARLISTTYVAYDKQNKPIVGYFPWYIDLHILGYFPGFVHSMPKEQTYIVLQNYLDANPFKEQEQDSMTNDQRHPFSE